MPTNLDDLTEAQKAKVVDGFGDELQGILDTAKEEEMYKSMPSFSVAGGYDGKGAYYNTINEKSEFIKDWHLISSYGAKTAAIRKMLQEAEYNHTSLSYHILDSLATEEEKGLNELKSQLKEAVDSGKSRTEIISLVSNYRSGENDGNKKAFLGLLIKLERMSDDIIIEYRKKASEQNPAFGVLKRAMDSSDLEKKDLIAFMRERSELLKEDPNDDDAKRAKKKAEMLELNKSYNTSGFSTDLDRLQSGSETSETFNKYFKPYYTNNQGRVRKNKAKEIPKDIERLKEYNAIGKFKTLHEETTKLSQELLVGAFNSNSETLSKVMYRPGEKNMKISSERLRSALTKSMKGMDQTLLTESMKKGILTNIVDKLSGKAEGEEGEKFRELISFLDHKYSPTSPKDKRLNDIVNSAPIDMPLEEEFQKVVEDAIYNEIAKHNGLNQAYVSLGGNLKNGEEIIDVYDNVKNKRYQSLSSNTQKKEDIGNKLLSFYNLMVLSEKIKSKGLNKVEIRDTIKNQIPIFDDNDTQAMLSTANTFLSEKKITAEDLNIVGEKGSDVLATDYFTEREVKNFNQELNYSGIRGAFARLGVISMNVAKLDACLSKAQNPDVSYHSTAAGTNECLKEFDANVDKKVDGIHQGLNSSALATSGFAPFLLLALMFSDNTKYQILLFKLDMERGDRGRENVLNFITDANDEIEEAYRFSALKVGLGVAETRVIDEEKVGEHIFRTIKAQHDYHKAFNAYLKPQNKNSMMSRIIGAQSEEEIAEYRNREFERIASAVEDGIDISNGQEWKKDKLALLKKYPFLTEKNLADDKYGIKELWSDKLRFDFDGIKSNGEDYDNGISAGYYTDAINKVKQARDEVRDTRDNISANNLAKVSLGNALLSQADAIEKGLREGAINAFEAQNEILKMQEALNLDFDEKALEIKNKLADGFISEEESLDELKRLKEELNGEIVGFSGIDKVAHKLTELEMKINATIDNVQESLENTEPDFTNLTKDEREKRIIDALSQKNSFKEGKSGEFSARMRYIGGNSADALFQDLKFFDFLEDNEALGDEAHEVAIAEKIIAMKSVAYESYISNMAINDPSLSREEILETLFRDDKYNNDMVSTAQLYIEAINQQDENNAKVQVLAIDKSRGKSFANAVKYYVDIIDDKNESVGRKAEASEILLKTLGKEISPHQYLKQNQRDNIDAAVAIGGEKHSLGKRKRKSFIERAREDSSRDGIELDKIDEPIVLSEEKKNREEEQRRGAKL